jgi:hypothetical protein
MRLILKSQSYWFPLMGALFFFLIGAGVSLALALGNSQTSIEFRDQAPLPFIGMSIVALLILVVGSFIISTRGVAERLAIRTVMKDAWAKWEQFDSKEMWRAFAEQSYATEMKRHRFPWGTLIVLVIMFSLVTGWTFFLASSDGADLIVVALPLGAFFTFVLIMTLGQVVIARNKIRSTFKRRLSSEIPNVYIGKRGIYDEDSGYRSFDGLINVYSEAGTPTTLNYQYNIYARYGYYAETVTVRVPSGKDAEAENIAQRYFDEGVVKR